jgi:DNA-binding HxlR family transcriptional regulator
LGRIGDRWTVLIVGALEEQERRFGQLLSLVSGISAKVLTQTLRTLERDGLVKREIFPETPTWVEYSLTELGRELVDPIATIRDWAVAHRERVISARELYDASSGAP